MKKLILGLASASLGTLTPIFASAQTYDLKSHLEQVEYYSTDKRTIKCKEAYQKRKYKKAYRKCLSAAEDGNLLAMVNLGFIKKKGVGDKSTKYWFKKAAEQGYPDAQYLLGDLLGMGQGFQWKIKAAKGGHSIAQMALGEFYENTDLGDPNYKVAVYWYEKAADQGVPYAQKRLQVLYSGGYAEKSDAAEVAKKMNPNGTVDAFIGAIQINSNWVEPGDAQSEILYAKGREIFDEGFKYAMGKATKKVDMQDSLPIFRQAAKRGNAKAAYMEGAMQPISESDADRDIGRLEQARLYTLSAEMGYKKAQYQLAELYNSGSTIAKSYPQAAYWYKRAAAQGHKQARDKLRYLLQWDRVSIDEIPQSTGETQHKFSPKENFYAGLEAGYKKQYKKAETLLLRSARKDYIPAQAALGRMYYDGEGVPRSMENSYKWYEIAANKGHVPSQYMMGYLWDSNATKDIALKMVLAGINVDRVLKARSWYSQAATNGHADAKVKLVALSAYKPVPPPPIKRGWLEQLAIDTYARSEENKYNYKPSGSTYTGGANNPIKAWRCYNIGNGREQCFNH